MFHQIHLPLDLRNQADAKPSMLRFPYFAQSQTLEFAGFSSKTDPINTGSITLDFGSWSGNTFTVNSSKSANVIAVTSSKTHLQVLKESLECTIE